MEELLKLIQVLREDASELIKNKDITKKEYDDVVKLFDDTFDSIQDESKELENLQLLFRSAKDTKILKFHGIISGAIMTSTFFLLKFLTNCQLSIILLMEVIILVFIPMTTTIFASTIFDSVIQKYLVKRYPNIKEMYDRVNALTNDIGSKERYFKKISSRKEVLNSILKSTVDKLRRKKEELEQLEDVYFDILTNKIITLEDGREETIDSKENAKKKVRIP